MANIASILTSFLYKSNDVTTEIHPLAEIMRLEGLEVQEEQREIVVNQSYALHQIQNTVLLLYKETD